MLESDDLNYNGDSPAPEEASNRTFLIAAGVLGGIVLLSIVCLAGYALFLQPGMRSEQQAQQATLAAQNTLVAQGLTGTAEALSVLPSPEATNTLASSPTPVVALATATSSEPTSDPATATVAAALTQAAIAQQTVFPTSTALPDTGFADEVGLPGLLIAAVVLLAVILLARRMRSAPAG
jgi:hypothetical protein